MENKRFYIGKNKNKVLEAVDPSKALLVKDKSDAYAILYGWRYKNTPDVAIAPEEHTEETLKDRIDQIVKDYNKYSYNSPRGNRYAKHHDFLFYILYNDKGYKFKVNEDYYKENVDNSHDIELEYDDLEVEVYTGSRSGYFDIHFGNWLPDDSSDTRSISWTYDANAEDVEEFFFEHSDTTFEKDLFGEDELEKVRDMSDEEYDNFLIAYILEHFDELVDKYYEELLDYFYDRAVEDARDNYDFDDYYESLNTTLEEGKKKNKNKKKKNKFGGKGPWLGWWLSFSKPDELGKFDSVHHNVGNMEANSHMINHANGVDCGGDCSVGTCGDGAVAGGAI